MKLASGCGGFGRQISSSKVRSPGSRLVFDATEFRQPRPSRCDARLAYGGSRITCSGSGSRQVVSWDVATPPSRQTPREAPGHAHSSADQPPRPPEPSGGVDLVAGSCVTHLDGAVAVIIENGNIQIAAPIPRSVRVTSAALRSIPIRNPWRDGLESLRSGWLRASRHSRVRRKAPAMAPAAHMLMSPYRALRRAIS
jgi:hypothetical protein